MDTPHLVWLCGALSGVCTFRDYFAPSGLVPLLRNGANRQHGHKIHSLRSVCTFRGYFVASLLVPP